MGRCNDEEFSGNVVEEDWSEWFESMTTKGGGKEEDVTRILGGKTELSSEDREEVGLSCRYVVRRSG